MLHRTSRYPLKCYKVMIEERGNKNRVCPYYFKDYGYIDVGSEMKPKQKETIEYLDEQDTLDCGIIHSYGNYKEAKDMFKLFCSLTLSKKIVIVECEIPAFTPYWKGACQEYASTRLITKQVIDRYVPDEITFNITFKDF